jgi:hypothetical protein
MAYPQPASEVLEFIEVLAILCKAILADHVCAVAHLVDGMAGQNELGDLVCNDLGAGLLRQVRGLRKIRLLVYVIPGACGMWCAAGFFIYIYWRANPCRLGNVMVLHGCTLLSMGIEPSAHVADPPGGDAFGELHRRREGISFALAPECRGGKWNYVRDELRLAQISRVGQIVERGRGLSSHILELQRFSALMSM